MTCDTTAVSNERHECDDSASAAQRSDPATGGYKAEAIEVLTLDGHGRTTHMTAFMRPDLFPRFGLPASIP